MGIILGSDSDLPVMRQGAEILDELDIGYEVVIASAHRTPERLLTMPGMLRVGVWKVIIAGAGGAAHLPGVIAALTTLPVIGVPMKTEALGAWILLYSIVRCLQVFQWPPWPSMGAKNAGIYAAQILALKYPSMGKESWPTGSNWPMGFGQGARLKELGSDLTWHQGNDKGLPLVRNGLWKGVVK